MLVNRMKWIALVSMFLLLILVTAGEALVIKGTHSGTINGGDPFSAEFQGTANPLTGQIALTVFRWPPWPDTTHWPPHMWAGCTMTCIYSTVFAKPTGGAVNFYDILGGSGDFTHTRYYTYPGHPQDSAQATVSIHLVPDSLIFSGNWVFNTSTLPTDFVDIAKFDQFLTPIGDGLVKGNATVFAICSNGDSMAISFTGVWDLGPGNNLPAPETGTCDFDLTEVNDTIYTVEGTCSLRPTGVIPTLTEWGLIIFGVVLLGFISWVFLRRRKAVVSVQ